MADSTVTTLLKQVRRGKRDCFRPLVERYERQVFLLACSIVGNPSDAQDIAQEAFVTAYQKLHSLADDTRFSSWLFGITRNLCYSHLRKRTVSVVPLNDESDQVAANVVSLSANRDEQQELLDTMLDRLNALPEKYQSLLRLKYLSDYSYDRIADMLDLPVDLVRSRLFEARRILRDEVEKKRGATNGQ